MIDIADLNPDRILVAGDWHRHMGARFAKKVIEYAAKHGINTIVHVGDFGFHFGHNAENGYIFEKPLQLALKKHGVYIVWIDGNHDAHQWLREQPRLANGFVKTGASGHVFYAPRGHRWTWSNRVFGALGGAWSFNWRYLKEGVNLFAKLEEVKQEDVDALGDSPLDYLISHDVPISVKMKSTLGSVYPEKSRALIQQAVDRTLPKRVFSGHWHQRRNKKALRADGGYSNVHVLDKENTASNFVILDLVNDKVIWPDDF